MRNTKKNLALGKNSLDCIFEDYEKLRKFRHDYNNHVNAIIGFLDMDRIDQAKKYLLEISADITPHMEILNTYSPSINIMLGSKMYVAKKQGIRTRIIFDLLTQPKISDVDMCTILCNGFDNAIEACMRCPKQERFIDATIHSGGDFKITLINNVNPKTIKRHRRKFITSKTDTVKHGIGLSSIKKAVDTYDGYVKAHYVGHDKFILEVLIKY